MPRRGKAKGIPKLGNYRRKGRKTLGRVFLDGKAHYCGEWGTAECQENYERLIAEWLGRGRKPAPPPPERILVARLAADYLRHALGYYRKGDRPTSEVDGIRSAIRPLLKLYSRTPAAEFSPQNLVTVRDAMVDVGMARTSINSHTGRIRRMFRWGVQQGLVPAEVIPGLDAVQGLRKERSAARETSPVLPPPETDINAVLPRVSRQVRAMVQLQSLTGMRPGEVASIRPEDIRRDHEIWEYVPQRHKTEHHNRGRVVMIGPRAQAVLAPFLDDRPSGEFCFSPREAEAERLERRHDRRMTSLSCGNRPGTNKARKPKRPPGACYTPGAYRKAVQRACESAGVEVWTPNQLRHLYATTARQSHGIEAAQVSLGHAAMSATMVYAERDLELARRVAGEIG